MTELLPEVRELPVDAVPDGELVALGGEGRPAGGQESTEG